MQQVLFDELRSMLIKPLEEVNPREAPDRRSRPLRLSGARLVDGLGGLPVEDAVVIVQQQPDQSSGGTRESDVDIPEDAEQIRCIRQNSYSGTDRCTLSLYNE
jgi:hypothetical protein